MKALRNGYLGLFTLIVGCVNCVTPTVEAQLQLPRIFNRDRDRDDSRPTPINRNSPDSVFQRSYGIPEPYSTKIETVKGHEVSFYIYARTKTPGMRVEFLIRDFPSAGKLISMVSNPENRSSAIVTYLADPNSGATMDAFTFASRYPGGQYSSAARCDIQIKDAQAMIELSSGADFGKVLIGQKAQRVIEMRNRGNAVYATTLNLAPPWKVISPAGGRLQLGPGSREQVTIEFDPKIPGTSNYDLILNRGDKGTCKIRGEAVAPFRIAGDEWELRVNPETGRREGDIIIASNHDRPFEVFLRSSPRLKVITSDYTVLAPGNENRLRVYLEKDDVMAFDGGLEIKMKQGYKEVTSVFGDTVPAKLSVEIPSQLGQEVIDFGKVTAGRSSERGIILKNLGGELMSLDVSVPEPFRLLSKTDRQLVPLESIPVTIGFYPHKSDRGGADQILTLSSNYKQTEIRLVGIALRPPGAPRPIPEPYVPKKPQNPGPTGVDTTVGNGNSSPSVASPDRLKSASRTREIVESTDVLSMAPFGAATRSLVRREIASNLKSAVDFELLKAKSKSLEFGWTAPKGSEIETFEVEIRGQRMNPLTQMEESVWVPYSDVEFKRVGRLIKAKVKELFPHTMYEFRVFTIDQNGRSSPPSLAFASKTERTMDWTYIYGTLVLMIAGLLGWGVVKIVRDRRGEVYISEFVKND